MSINIETLAQAAMEGTGYQHLTLAQAWAAHLPDVDPAKLVIGEDVCE